MTEILLLWKSFGILQAIDVVIVAAGVFALIRTFWTSGTVRIAVGLLIACTIFVLANMFDLQGVAWIYSRLSPVLLIAAIVIFHPEIRRLLERGVCLRRRRGTRLSSGLPELLVDTLATLSEKRWGAIIVLPGNDPVDPWLSTGVRLDAEPSVPLMLSLFDPHSPGHDGAAIIDGMRVTRFAVRLPLAKSEKLKSDYGTRHYASLGLAEATDALVLTVSEERGTVSLFHAGQMTALESATSAATAINKHARMDSGFGGGDASGRRVRSYLIQIAASLVAAVVLWACISLPSVEVVERSIDVAIDYLTPAELALVGSKPVNAKLHLAGDERSINFVDPHSLNVRIDLSKALPGKQTVVITPDDVKLPKYVRLIDVEPASFDVTLNTLAEREVPVSPQLVGQLPPGFSLQDVSVKPALVRAISPANDPVASERGLTTSPIYLQGLSSSSVLYVKIIAPPYFQPVDRRWPDVEVRVEISKDIQSVAGNGAE